VRNFPDKHRNKGENPENRAKMGKKSGILRIFVPGGVKPEVVQSRKK
jgi:hypothetical protein